MSLEAASGRAVRDAMERLLAGREPRQACLERCARLENWSLTVREIRHRRRIVISGSLKSERFIVRHVEVACAPVLWMDRKRRFALTTSGLWNLGTRKEFDDR